MVLFDGSDYYHEHDIAILEKFVPTFCLQLSMYYKVQQSKVSVKETRLRGYKTWVHYQTQNKAQWLAACGHVSASSQSLRFILSLRMY